VKEVVSKRTATSKTFDLGGGKFRLEAGGHAHHGPPGAMVETSRAFIDDPTEFRSGQHPCDIRLPGGYAQPLRFGHGQDTVIVRALDFNTPPSFGVLEDDVVTYEQAYDGIDVLYRLTNTGLKAVYRITSEAGQREISFEVSGDFDKYHQAPFWMDESEPIPVRVDVPFTANGSTRTYDFTSVPVGTDVDPTLGPAASYAANGTYANDADWSNARNGIGNYQATYETPRSNCRLFDDKYRVYRGCDIFDTSSIDDEATIGTTTFGPYISETGTGDSAYTLVVAPTSGGTELSASETALEGWGTVSAGGEASSTTGRRSVTVDTAVITINKTGYTHIGSRSTRELDNEAPSGTTSFGVTWYAEDGDYPSTLTVEYEIPATGNPYYYRTFVLGG